MRRPPPLYLIYLLFTLLFCLVFTGCQGLTLTVQPDGSVSASYTYQPPVKAKVVDDKGSK